MKQLLRATLLALPLLTATQAWALFDVQLMTGKRSTTFKSSSVSDSLSGNELKAAAHLDPIPLVPIGFGITASQTKWDDSSKFGVKSIDGFDLGLEVEAWLPLQLMGLVPYAKVGYTVAGAYAFKSSGVGGIAPTTVYKPTGLYLAAGLRWEFLLRFGVMLELEKATRKLAFDSYEDLGNLPASSLPKDDVDADSTSILFGIQAGL